jgi:signal transduction histidine kinase
MSVYSFPPLISSLLFLFLGIVSFLNSKSTKIVTYGLTLNCFVTFLWQFSWFLLFNIHDPVMASLIIKVGYSGIIFIPFTFFHFHVSFIDARRYLYLIRTYYFIGFVFFILLWSSDLFIAGYYKYFWGFYPKAGLLHPIFLIFLIFSSMQGAFLLLKKGLQIKWLSMEGGQILFLLTGFLVYFLAAIDFLVNYGFQFYPPGFIFILISLGFCVYAIVRYRLLDIRIVITRLSVFVLVYSLVLGIPVWIGFLLLGKGLWLAPITLMGFLATLGPFIYFYIQKRAEDRLLKEQRSYQDALRQASGGMGKVKDLEKLLYLIVHVLTRTVRLEHTVIYIHDEIKKIYKLGAFKHRSSSIVFHSHILEKHSIIEYLNKNHVSIVMEEIKQKAQDSKDLELFNIKELMQGLGAALVVPIYIENRLIAFVGMGKKESGKSYSNDDLAVFSILSNQVSLAIENAQFYEEMKITQEQLFQAEKMATIGIMADGLSHQINNRFHAMGFISGDALDTIQINKNLEMSDKLKDIMSELERALIRIQDNVTQGGEVVQGLLKYTRKGEEGLFPVDVDSVVSSAYEMAQFKIKSYQMSLIRDYDKNLLPKVKGNSTQLQEVFFNLIDNAYDAMMQRKNDLKEPEYHPKLTIYAEAKGKNLEMIFEDNGAGVKEEDVQKLFTPFFTTKLSSKKGTGLGLYVIRKIIEDNHQGKVEFSSKFMIGTQMKVYLPLFIDTNNK